MCDKIKFAGTIQLKTFIHWIDSESRLYSEVVEIVNCTQSFAGGNQIEPRADKSA